MRNWFRDVGIGMRGQVPKWNGIRGLWYPLMEVGLSVEMEG